MPKPQKLVKDQLAAFGANLKQHRLRKGWTLDELASRSKLSKAFISRLESGDRQASISAVLTLSQIFGVSLASMFETQAEMDPCLIVRKSEAVSLEANGLTYVPLSYAGRHFNLRPIRVTVSPKRTGTEHYHHDGEEWIYVLTGEISLSIAGEIYELDAGDAIHFDSRLPHRVSARGKTAPEILLVASPLSLERSNVGTTFLRNNSHRAITMPDFGDYALERSLRS